MSGPVLGVRSFIHICHFPLWMQYALLIPFPIWPVAYNKQAFSRQIVFYITLILYVCAFQQEKHGYILGEHSLNSFIHLAKKKQQGPSGNYFSI